jgi:hypothetical protein
VRDTGFRSKFTSRQPKRHKIPSLHSDIIDAQESNFLKVTVISFAYLSAGSVLVLFCVPLNGSIFLTLFDKWFGTARVNCEKKNKFNLRSAKRKGKCGCIRPPATVQNASSIGVPANSMQLARRGRHGIFYFLLFLMNMTKCRGH